MRWVGMRLEATVLSLACLLVVQANLAALTPHVFRPSATEPLITEFDNRHYAYVDEAATAKRNKLLVFLPGTGGTPYFYQELLQHAAGLGYHALGLMYPNERAVGTLCAIQDRRNPDCHRAVRLEIIDGTDRTTLVEIDRTNSIEHRLERALAYLHTGNASEGWGQFYHQDGSVVWDRIVICGHSQGGGHAALIAKQRLVDRCLIFAAADWFPFEDRPANWASEPSITPIHKVFIFAHLRDPLVLWERVLPFARAGDFDRFGEPVSVDSADSARSFGYRHILTTDVDADNLHNAVVVDAHTPRNPVSGEPVFLPVWSYMLLSETPALAFERQDETSVSLYWHSDATLQESVDLVDWDDLVGSESPLVVPLESIDPRIFFRVRQ